MKTLRTLLIISLLCMMSGCTSNTLESTDVIDIGIKDDITIISVYDTFKLDTEMEYGDGFACIINTSDTTILLDTPYQDRYSENEKNGLLRNMEKLNIDPGDIDLVVISHSHAKSGLEAFLVENSDVIVYSPGEINIKDMVEEAGATYKEVDEFLEIADDVFITGGMEGMTDGSVIYEQSMVLKTDKGLIVMSDCSHPGIIEILDKTALAFPDEEIFLLYAGLHIKSVRDEDVFEALMTGFESYGIEWIVPTHCSGNGFRTYAKNYEGINFISGGVGTVINIE